MARGTDHPAAIDPRWGERRLEVAFVRGMTPPDLPSWLQVTRLFEDALVVVLPAQHPLAARERAAFHRSPEGRGFRGMYPRESGTGCTTRLPCCVSRRGLRRGLPRSAGSRPPSLVGGGRARGGDRAGVSTQHQCGRRWLSAITWESSALRHVDGAARGEVVAAGGVVYDLLARESGVRQGFSVSFQSTAPSTDRD